MSRATEEPEVEEREEVTSPAEARGASTESRVGELMRSRLKSQSSVGAGMFVAGGEIRRDKLRRSGM